MEKHLYILDMDGNGPEEVLVQYDTIIPEFHMRHVIDLASIVDHQVPRGSYITEYLPEYMPVLV